MPRGVYQRGPATTTKRDKSARNVVSSSECKIALSRGFVATVDPEDYEWLSQYNWHAQPQRSGGVVYAMRGIEKGDSKSSSKMHQEIGRRIWGDGDFIVDHRDRDGLNNRRKNLRKSTRSGNAANRKVPTTNTSGYKGVSWRSVNSKWTAYITARGKRITLGCFTDIEEAARAYDRAALELFGEFARINFPLHDEVA